jgi:hypothetical protein
MNCHVGIPADDFTCQPRDSPRIRILAKLSRRAIRSARRCSLVFGVGESFKAEVLLSPLRRGGFGGELCGYVSTLISLDCQWYNVENV